MARHVTVSSLAHSKEGLVISIRHVTHQAGAILKVPVKVELEPWNVAFRTDLRQEGHMETSPQTHVDTATIAEKAVALLNTVLEGGLPNLAETIAVRDAMLRATDLQQPMNLGQQLMQSSGLDDEVGQAMIDLLQANRHSSAKQLEIAQATFHRSASKPGTSNLSRHQSFDSSRRLSKDVTMKLFSSSSQIGSLAPAEYETDQQAEADYVDLALAPVVEQLLQEAADSWAFDIFQLAEQCHNRPLSSLGFYLIKGSGLISFFNLDEEKLACFLRGIEDGYIDNPYHSCTHAASVLQIIHMLVQNGLIQSGILDEPMQLSCYMAAICHDYAHPGLTNDFLIKTRHKTAVTYNDISPLENMHVSSSFMVAYTTPGADFAEPMSAVVRSMGRASVIELILGTDMKKHFSTLSRFQAIANPKAASFFSDAECPRQHSNCPAFEPGYLSNLAADQKLLVAQVALKAADIAHLAAPLGIHQRWTTQLTEEFFRQGDRERSLNMKISPLMDRDDSAGMVKSQVGFFEIVALPLFKGFVELIPACAPLLDGVMANYEYWRSL
ncbi:hypothetical protein WJX74_001194 [Apatococcus lobatus]|uniref:Phosphodiesterase n=1 Tax=Apatococcus lobatus TaxID=904363 RepID=A0AAW1QXN4_9CHLO